MTKAVLDTNIFVAASFNKHSSSAKILKNKDVKIIWDKETLKETRLIVKKIPPIKWEKIKNFFLPENEFKQNTDIKAFSKVEDVDDRKFIALARASNAVLITNDDHLLSVCKIYKVEIITPKHFVKKFL